MVESAIFHNVTKSGAPNGHMNKVKIQMRSMVFSGCEHLSDFGSNCYTAVVPVEIETDYSITATT